MKINALTVIIASAFLILGYYSAFKIGLERGRKEGEKVGALCALYDLNLVDSITEDVEKTSRSVTLKLLEVGPEGLKKTDGKSSEFRMDFPYFQPVWYPFDTGRKSYRLQTEVQIFAANK